MADPLATIEPPVVLFDGVCNLCNGTVQFLIDHDRGQRLRFAALQSEAGARVLQAHGRTPPTGDPDSVVLVEGGRVYERSDAALRIAIHGMLPKNRLGRMMQRHLRIYKAGEYDGQHSAQQPEPLVITTRVPKAKF